MIKVSDARVNLVGSTFNIQNFIPHKSQKAKAASETDRAQEFQRGTVGAKEGTRVLAEGSDIDLGTEIAKRFRVFAPFTIVRINRSGRDRKPDFNRTVSQDKTNDVLPETDILIMAVPGTDETRHFISDERIALLPKHAVIINIGRGNVLDPEALMNALKKERIFGAALDVFEKEPLEEDGPM